MMDKKQLILRSSRKKSSSLLLIVLMGNVTQALGNLYMHGAIVAQPCVISPGSEEILLDFGSVTNKELYINKRTPGQIFELRLTECDVSLVRTVSFTFTGVENPNLRGLLALAMGSEASGIAIGMETPHGLPLPINHSSGKYPLQKGSTVIQMQAYVEGEPNAISQRTIGHGTFNAIATFNLAYE
jgi:type 1 fimbria pilin